MLVPDPVRKCVCFIFYLREGKATPAGTAFFLGYASSGAAIPGEAPGWGATVTAQHVVDGVMGRSDDGKAYLRLNTPSGGLATIATEAADWITHPEGRSADLAVYPFVPAVGVFDHLVYTGDHALTDELIYDENIGVGDEVFLAGLFANRIGVEQNIPIVRIGNIAAMPGEKIETPIGPMDAYLIEARSLDGLRSCFTKELTAGAAKSTQS